MSIQVISVLIGMNDDTARAEIVNILTAAEDMEVVGAVRTGDAVIALTKKLEPDILLLDCDLPGRDGIETTETITASGSGIGVILLSADMSSDVLRRAMVAGARQFLQMPPNPEELLRAIYQVHDTTSARKAGRGHGEGGATTRRREGQTIAVFSPKGGVGVTTIAASLAVAIRQEAAMRVALVDGSLPFGDVGVFMDIAPTRSMMDIQVPNDQMDADFIDTALTVHERSGVKVLLAPQRPEMVDMVTAELLRKALTLLRDHHEYVVVDTWSALDERVLTILEVADKVLLVTSLELSSIKSAKVFLEVAELLKFPPQKIMLVVTRATAPVGITVADVESTLGRSVDVRIPSDDRNASRSINEGDPIVMSGRGTPVAQAISELARQIVAENYPELHDDMAAALTTAARNQRFKLFPRNS